MAKKMVVFVGSDEPQKAFPPFMLGSGAIAMDMKLMLFFTMNGLNIVKKGGAEKIKLEGAPKSLPEFIDMVEAAVAQCFVPEPVWPAAENLPADDAESPLPPPEPTAGPVDLLSGTALGVIPRPWDYLLHEEHGGTFHDAEKGINRGRNTIYLIEIEDVMLCHLGDLGHPLSSEQVEEMSRVEVLLVPVGGVSTIDAATAAETVRLLQPRIVIPMHFQTDVLRFQLEPVDRFLREMGIKAGSPAQPRLSITKASLPDETQVVVLDYRSTTP